MGHEGKERSGVLLAIPFILSHKISDLPSDFRKTGKTELYSSIKV